MSGHDRSLFSVLVAYQDAVLGAYVGALQAKGVSRLDRERLAALRTQAGRAAEAVRATIASLGGKPPAAAPAPSPAGSDRIAFLIETEQGAVNAWYRALQSLDGARVLGVAAAQMTAGGRRLVVLRDIAGQPLLPSAFETGGV